MGLGVPPVTLLAEGVEAAMVDEAGRRVRAPKPSALAWAIILSSWIRRFAVSAMASCCV